MIEEMLLQIMHFRQELLPNDEMLNSVELHYGNHLDIKVIIAVSIPVYSSYVVLSVNLGFREISGTFKNVISRPEIK